MRKYIIAFLFVVLALSATACSNNKTWRAEIEQIYEVNEGSLGTSDEKLNHGNVISYRETRLDEKLVGNTKKYQLGEKTYELIYDTTVIYPTRDYELVQYKIEDTKEGVINFYEDGTLASYMNLYDPIFAVDISKTDSAETVRMAVEPIISSFIDLAKYEYLDVEPTFSIEENGRFGLYMFKYYNKQQEYHTDGATVCVKDNGFVVGLTIENLKINNSSIGTINKEREWKLLEEKLKSFCDTEEIEYRSYEMSKDSTPYFTMCKGELCVSYVVSCKIYDFELARETSFKRRLLIPVRLLVEE